MESRIEPDLPQVGNDIVMTDSGWDFAKATETFEEHIKQSIPLCEEGRAAVADLSTFFIVPGSNVYEIGISTGALARQVLARNKDRAFNYVGIDVVPEMVAQAAKVLAHDDRFTAEIADATDYRFQPASLFLSYYVVQFIPPSRRQLLIDKLYTRLEWGGAFIMYEKVRGPDARFQDILTQLYMDFKLENGFTPDEVINKTKSLKGILEPFSTAGNLSLLTRAGFQDIMIVHKFGCFEGYLAIK